MSKKQPSQRASRRPVDNRPKHDNLRPDEKFNSVSVPRREMIMPREYNSASDPNVANETKSQITSSSSSFDRLL